MQEELTVRVEHPELPAIRWNEAEVQQNLTEMLAAYTGRVYFVRFQRTVSGKPFRPERQPCRQHRYAGRIPVRAGGDHRC